MQSDINGIPISAIERIEILPSSAGGIYGGGAVGGVINIIRKRDYKGIDLRLAYRLPFRGGGEFYDISISGGIGLEQGKTQISFSAAQSDANPLYAGDNNLWRRGRELYLRNSPFQTSPVSGYTTNICSAIFSFACSGYYANLFPDFFDEIPLTLDDATHWIQLYVGASWVSGYSKRWRPSVLGGRLNSIPNCRMMSTVAVLPCSIILVFVLQISTSAVALRQRSMSLAISHGRIISADPYMRHRWAILSLRPTHPTTRSKKIFLSQIPVLGIDRPATTRSQSLAATGGAIARLGRGWMATAEYGWSRSRMTGHSVYSAIDSILFNAAVRDGTLDVLRDLNQFPIDFTPYLREQTTDIGPINTTREQLSVRASGPLFRIWGSTVVLTALAERRVDRVGDVKIISRNADFTPTPYQADVRPARSQSVNSGYIELRAPIVSDANGMAFIRSLEATLALRHDRYKPRTTSPLQYALNFETDPVPALEYDVSRMKSTDFTATLLWSPSRILPFGEAMRPVFFRLR